MPPVIIKEFCTGCGTGAPEACADPQSPGRFRPTGAFGRSRRPLCTSRRWFLLKGWGRVAVDGVCSRVKCLLIVEWVWMRYRRRRGAGRVSLSWFRKIRHSRDARPQPPPGCRGRPGVWRSRDGAGRGRRQPLPPCRAGCGLTPECPHL